MKLKLCVVGDRAVGKTSLLNRFVYDTFSDVYRGTLGSRLCLLTFKEIVAGKQLVEAEVAMFDLMGERGLRDAFREVMFWNTHGFLAVADVTRPDTIRSLPAWIRAVTSVTGDVPYRILANKADLAPRGAIAPEDTAWLLSELPGAPYHLTSAKTSGGVHEAFEALIGTMVETTLTASRMRQRARLVGDKILAFAHRRRPLGVSKGELLAAFKEVGITILMREVEDLQQLGLAVVEPTGPTSFLLKLTEKGEQEFSIIERANRIVDEAW